MGFKGLLAKIEPKGTREQMFYNVLNNVRSLDSDSRAIAHAFMNESTPYVVAQTLADDALAWLQGLTISLEKFEAAPKIVIDSSRVKFIDWVRNEGNSYRKTKTSFLARSGTKFIAEYDLVTNKVSIMDDFDEDHKALSLMKLYNELGV